MLGGMMDAALIGAGVIGAAKYGPLALAKAKTMGESAYGFAQTQVANAKAYTAGASGAAGQFASRGMEYASGVPGRTRTAATQFGASARDAFRGPYAAPGYGPGASSPMGPYGPPTRAQNYGATAGRAGQKTFGFGKNLASGIGKGVRRLFRIPV